MNDLFFFSVYATNLCVVPKIKVQFFQWNYGNCKKYIFNFQEVRQI